MMDGCGLRLVLEARNSDFFWKYPRYNEVLVNTVVEDIWTRFSEAMSIMDEGCEEESSTMTRLLLLHLILKRNRRCLVVYHDYRLSRLLGYYRTAKNVETGIRNRENLQRGEFIEAEKKVVDRYREMLNRYRRAYADLALFGMSRASPGNVYVRIHMKEDVGRIQTENGELVLAEHSLHRVRYSEIEHLVAQGKARPV